MAQQKRIRLGTMRLHPYFLVNIVSGAYLRCFYWPKCGLRTSLQPGGVSCVGPGGGARH